MNNIYELLTFIFVKNDEHKINSRNEMKLSGMSVKDIPDREEKRLYKKPLLKAFTKRFDQNYFLREDLH